jgi:phosphatidylserine/phosphatidylglycerophosphate/cardiolipin synthase-like enzyme
MKIHGEPVWDLTNHFIQYWNYAICNLKLRNIGSVGTDMGCFSKTYIGIRQGFFYVRDLARRGYRKCFPVKDPRRYGRYIQEIAGDNQ